MDYQLYITYLIVSIAVGFAIYHVYELVFEKKSACSSCAGGCSLKTASHKNIKVGVLPIR